MSSPIFFQNLDAHENLSLLEGFRTHSHYILKISSDLFLNLQGDVRLECGTIICQEEQHASNYYS